MLPWNHNKLSGERTSLSWFLFLFINQKDYDTFIVRSQLFASCKFEVIMRHFTHLLLKHQRPWTDSSNTCIHLHYYEFVFNNNTKSRCYQARDLVVSSKYTLASGQIQMNGVEALK